MFISWFFTSDGDTPSLLKKIFKYVFITGSTTVVYKLMVLNDCDFFYENGSRKNYFFLIVYPIGIGAKHRINTINARMARSFRWGSKGDISFKGGWCWVPIRNMIK